MDPKIHSRPKGEDGKKEILATLFYCAFILLITLTTLKIGLITIFVILIPIQKTMSVQVADTHVIAYIVTAAMHGPSPYDGDFHWHTPEGPTKIGSGDFNKGLDIAKKLQRTNLESYCNRYDDSYTDEEIDITEKYLTDYTFVTHDAFQVIRSAKYLAYQCSHCPDWDKSEAKYFLDRLITHATDSLEEIKKAIWGAPRPETLPSSI